MLSNGEAGAAQLTQRDDSVLNGSQSAPSSNEQNEIHVDVLIVGAGFSGMTAIHRLREAELTVKCFEASGDFGGVWNFNRYDSITERRFATSAHPGADIQGLVWMLKYPSTNSISLKSIVTGFSPSDFQAMKSCGAMWPI